MMIALSNNTIQPYKQAIIFQNQPKNQPNQPDRKSALLGWFRLGSGIFQTFSWKESLYDVSNCMGILFHNKSAHVMDHLGTCAK